MLPDRVSNPGPLTYESGALPIALRRPALILRTTTVVSLGVPIFRVFTVSEISESINKSICVFRTYGSVKNFNHEPPIF